MRKPNDFNPGTLPIVGIGRRGFKLWLFRRGEQKLRTCAECFNLLSARNKGRMHKRCFEWVMEKKLRAEYIGEPVATTEEKPTLEEKLEAGQIG